MKPVLVRKFIEDEPRIYFDEESWHNSDRSEVRRSRGGLWQRGGYDSYMADDEWETLEGSDSTRLEAEYQRLVKAGEVEDIDAIQDRPQWIPVDERLPEVDEHVLACWVPRKDGMACAVIRTLNGKCVWTPGDQWTQCDAPTHWMPLPEPPEVKP